MTDEKELTVLINKMKSGDHEVADKLMPLLYDELYDIARKRRIKWQGGHTMNTTALVHEAFIKLQRSSELSWNNRYHFLSVASRAMRCILVDHARKHKAAKRGGDQKSDLEYDDQLLCSSEKADDILALEDALQKLEKTDERCSKIVEYRFFGGLNIEETAGVLGVSTATVKRGWQFAKNWLYQEIKQQLTP